MEAGPFPAAGGAWRTGLCECEESLTYAYAAVCPCVMIHNLYALTTHRPVLTGTHDPFTLGYTQLLSLLVCTPGCLCLDQCATRGLDRLANRVRAGQDANETPGLFDHILRVGHFGDMYAPRWAHDGHGWDLAPNASEDWWPLGWCCHYACELGQAACVGKALGGSAPRMPLCFSCALGLCYPLMLCPITFLLRRIIVDQERVDEPCPTSCAVSALCTPCAIVQMTRELSHEGASPYHYGAQNEAPLMTNQMGALDEG